MFSVRWNNGVHNWMTYITGDIPVGAYDSSRLANIGIGHGAIDGGGGYTYFNPMTGHEFSAVLGFTYNLENQSTQYQNGVDMHLDWGASQFVTKQLQLGLVGYVYKQLSCDSGAGDRVGCFESQVFGVGPQIGYVIPLGGLQGYLNLKGYKEFGAEHRPEGWNTWLTFVISPAPPSAAPPPRPQDHQVARGDAAQFTTVMPGLSRASTSFLPAAPKTWMPGTRPGMTVPIPYGPRPVVPSVSLAARWTAARMRT